MGIGIVVVMLQRQTDIYMFQEHNKWEQMLLSKFIVLKGETQKYICIIHKQGFEGERERSIISISLNRCCYSVHI